MEGRIKKRGTKVMQNTIFFLIALLLVSFDVVAQGENHKHGHHRHPEFAEIENPVAKTGESVTQGRKLYEKHCMACHGESGKGGIGPALSGQKRIHGSADGETFHVITDGVAGTAMKGFKKELSDEMRWHLVNYTKSLKKSGGK